MAAGPKAPAGAILLASCVAESNEYRDVFPAKQRHIVNSPKRLAGTRFDTAYYTPNAMATISTKATESWQILRNHEAKWSAPRLGHIVRIIPIEEFELGNE